MAQDNKWQNINFAELGVTGLRRFGPYVYEEFLPALTGLRAVKIYNEMSKNDPTIGALLFAVKMLIRQVEWPVEKFSDAPADVQRSDFLKSCFDDMELPWSHTVAEILSMLPFGWSWHEEVFKVRAGPEFESPELKSAHDDGMIGWRKLPIRSQDSFWQWEFNDVGDVTAMIQVAPPDFRPRRIPREKSLLFRTDVTKNNPEGYSILRNAYRPWYLKNHIENIEAVGIERDLAGIPVAWAPPEIMADDASDSQKAQYEALKKIVTNIKRDEGEGMVLPLAYDENGNKQFDFTLLQTAGRRQFDTTIITNRYKTDMLMSCLADWMMLGHTKVGTFSLSSSKTELFSSAIGAWLDEICNVMNRYAIPRLFRLNGMDERNMPKLSHGDIESADLEELSKFITALAGAGAELFPNDDLQRWCMQQAGMPVQQQEHGKPLNPAKPPEQPAAAATPNGETEKDELTGLGSTYAMRGSLMSDCPNCQVGNVIDPVGPWPAAQKCVGCDQLYNVAEPKPDVTAALSYGTKRERTA